jgi:hypothetical protein
MKAITFALVLGGMLLAAPASVAVTCPQQQSTEAALANASVAFVGTVTATSDSDRIADVEVVAVWKGPDLQGRVSVWGTSAANSAPASTDLRFMVGATYLIIPETAREPFLATSCSATQRSNNTGLAIPIAYQDDVGATTGRSPVDATVVPVETPPLPDRTLVAGVAAAGLLTAGVGIAARRRSARQRRTAAEEYPSKPKKREPRFRVRRLSITGLLTRLARPSGMKRASRERKKHKAGRC